jgi:hypothetical protein
VDVVERLVDDAISLSNSLWVGGARRRTPAASYYDKVVLIGWQKTRNYGLRDRDETGRASQKWKVKKDIKFEAYAGLPGPTALDHARGLGPSEAGLKISTGRKGPFSGMEQQ